MQGARAIDKDQQGPFNTVEYLIVQGPYSDYVSFVSPLSGTLVLRKTLDYEQLSNFTVTLRAQDHGTPPKYTDTNLTILVEDADDQNPAFIHQSYTAVVYDRRFVGPLMIEPESIHAIDKDAAILAPVMYEILPSTYSHHFSMDSSDGKVSLIIPIDGHIEFASITLILRATQINNADRYALTTLVVKIVDVSIENIH